MAGIKYRDDYMVGLDMLFVSMPSRANSLFHPLAFVMLCGFIEKYSDLKVDIFEAKLQSYKSVTVEHKDEIENLIVALVDRVKPRYVGFSLFPGDLHEFLPLAEKIKVKTPKVKIVVGGVLPTIEPELFFREKSAVDVVIKGDGEQAILDLLNGREVQDISGVWTNGSRGGHARYTGDFDYLPSYEKIDMHYYCQVSTGIIRPYYTKGILVLSSIGCPHQCTFCFNPSRSVKFKNIDVFISELKLLKQKYDINSFGIIDECFLAKRARVYEFCEKYTKEDISLPFSMQTRANLLDEEMTAKLKDAGCVQIAFGVESGSNKILEKINKGMVIEEDMRAFSLCKKYGIKTFANILFNLPGETADDIELTRKFLRTTKPTHVALSLTVPLLGTKIYDDYVKPPLLPSEYKIYSSNDPYVNLVDKRFRLADHDIDLNKLMLKESIKFYLKSSFGLVTLEKWYTSKILRHVKVMELVRAMSVKISTQLITYSKAVLKVVFK